MDISLPLAALNDHQNRALDVLARSCACVAEGPDAVEARSATLRAEMATVLSDYQVFKHERIFNPALTHADPGLAGLAREMKVECIAAGETFRAHLQGWRVEDIRGAWTNYQAAARLTINQPRRHIDREAEGITVLLTALQATSSRTEP